MLALMTLGLPGAALAVDPAHHGDYASCTQGDCRNGVGTIKRLDLDHSYTGQWSNGRFIDGVYQVEYDHVPGQTFPMTYGADGLPKHGTLPMLTLDKAPIFTGSFGPPPESFADHGNQMNFLLRRQGAVLRQGRYETTNNYIYEGRFEYVPLLRTLNQGQHKGFKLARGVYIFMGVRIDNVMEEVRTGIYVSQEVAPEQAPEFTAASPSYLARLSEELANDRARHQQQAQAKRASKEVWDSLVNALGDAVTDGLVDKALSPLDLASPAGSLGSISELRSVGALAGTTPMNLLVDVLQGQASASGAIETLVKEPLNKGQPARTHVMPLADYLRLKELQPSIP